MLKEQVLPVNQRVSNATRGCAPRVAARIRRRTGPGWRVRSSRKPSATRGAAGANRGLIAHDLTRVPRRRSGVPVEVPRSVPVKAWLE